MFLVCNGIPLLHDQYTLIKMRISRKPSGLKLGAHSHSLQLWNDCRCSLGLLKFNLNPLNAELNPICSLLALLGGATIVVVNRLRVNFNHPWHAVYNDFTD
jgi:hypothetical protein